MYKEHRDAFYDFVKGKLIAPAVTDTENGESYLIGTTPSSIIPTGLLYPLSSASFETDEDDDSEDNLNTQDEISTHRAVPKRKHFITPPSSAGMSFYASNDIVVHAFPGAVRYENSDENHRSHRWKRITLSEKNEEVFAELSPPSKREKKFIKYKIWEDRAEITSLWRPFQNGWIVTVTLCNIQKEACDESDKRTTMDKNEELILFEAALKCEVVEGEIYPYPRKDISLMNDEEVRLEIQYRHKKIYAIGHGVAVDWEESPVTGKLKRIWIDFLPKVEVPIAVTSNQEIPEDTLDIKILGTLHTEPEAVSKLLQTFLMAYEEWHVAQQEQISALEKEFQEHAQKIIGEQHVAIERIRDGIILLNEDRDAATAFALANQVMLHQMQQNDTATKGEATGPYRWRPFQLAFLLMSLDPIINPDTSEFRDVVDLIWFPTGGGKTEAYLAVIAFTILYRRMKFKTSGGGTSVIMRYTLRLLTQQQFVRASRMICALELLRRKDIKRLGSEPVTTGMWVGGAISPNTFEKGIDYLHNANDQDGFSCLVIIECPWCGKSLWKEENGKIKHGFDASLSHFTFRCINPECEFHDSESGLPLNVIDEALYKHPPTLLFATVDKFARLAWDERAKSFFGKDVNRPPELIVQDELHLICDALGSIAGIYEAAIDTVIQLRGVMPKYIASTATIKNAKMQVERLYARKHSVFPPPGLSSDDAFFIRTDKEKQGRLYVGYLPALLNKSRAYAVLSSALVSAPLLLFNDQQDREALMDAWWTTVVYHGSLRGVGDSHNVLEYNVNHYLPYHLNPGNPFQTNKEFISRHKAVQSKENINISAFDFRIEEITSRKSAAENSLTFQQLGYPYHNSSAIDVVLATNMIATGLDVERLALMVIKGQPLTTAEYIQASSRIGRGDIPGIIFINYYRTQSRSLSHYENFRPYHESFYRFVEPATVTPFTYQARQRALHAAFVIVMRHSFSHLAPNANARNFDPEMPDIQRAIRIFSKRCMDAAPENFHKDIANHIENIAGKWLDYIHGNSFLKVVYSQQHNDKSARPLLITFEQNDDKGCWHTLNSMRQVEDSAIYVWNGDRGK